MKIKRRLSAYSLDEEIGKPILDPKEYSNFKYGHKPTVFKFASALLKGLFDVYSPAWLIENRSNVVITTSPYWHTPPSAHSLAVTVHHMLNEALFEQGHGALPFVKISRSSAPSCDFSQLDARERKLNMQNNKLTVDRQAVKGKTVIFVEDARITGAHEVKTLECLEKAGVAEVVLLYIIDVKNKKMDPNIENILNHSVIDSLDELARLTRNPKEYILNSRACRFVLSWQNRKELIGFCATLPDEILSQLYIASTTDGYGLMAKYQSGFDVVRAEVKSRQNMSIIKSIARLSTYIKQVSYSVFF